MSARYAWRRRLGAVLGLAALGLCQGCGSTWPEAGQGGMAEKTWPAPLAAPSAVVQPQLRDALTASLQRTEAAQRLVEQTGKATGRMAEIDQIATRARREFAGGLYSDLPGTLDRLDAEVRRLCSTLDKPGSATADCS
jgi:hypothetical protein